MSKKKTTEPIYTYKLEVIPTYEPTKWEAGTWEQNKEKEWHFTGKEIKKPIGYQANYVHLLRQVRRKITKNNTTNQRLAVAISQHIRHFWQGRLWHERYKGK